MISPFFQSRALLDTIRKYVLGNNKTGNSFQLAKSELEFLPEIIRIQETPPVTAARWLSATIATGAVIAIIWGFIGTIDVYAQAQGRLVPAGHIKSVQAVDGGVVSSILMTEGQYVKRGQVLLKLDPLMNEANLNSLIEKINLTKIELRRFEAELDGKKANYDDLAISDPQRSLQDALYTSRDMMHAARVAEARNSLHTKKSALNTSEDTLLKSNKLLITIREREEKIRPYVGEVMPKFDYLRLKDSLVQAENDIDLGTNKVVEAKEEVRAAEQRIVQISQEWRGEILAEISKRRSDLIQFEADLTKLRQLASQRELRSPVDGTLQNVEVSTIGSVLGAGQTVAKIVPSSADLIVEAVLPNEDVGFVEINQKVVIKIDGYPSHRYGSINGTVVQISPDAEDMNYSSADTDLSRKTKSVPSRSSVLYRIRIKPELLAIKHEGVSFPLVSGMTLVADIKTDRRRIIDFLIAPIVSNFSSAVKDR
ncbi:HlyD family type I secretion periplasmic adaptor subunit [Duganella levis]|uniref:Membrane fusion protein (MFP) family protein n=1 Tax=Duganella levis TaxID=2692169 RepID=A0ABW9W943_9BURK|nr:HlyD family type I secretion periplasmic adaptor subunit [Duganella levis]MYN30110.1 HlyD family type I secretion periplasmic adaptor subunit [Duganella levis]